MASAGALLHSSAQSSAAETSVAAHVREAGPALTMPTLQGHILRGALLAQAGGVSGILAAQAEWVKSESTGRPAPGAACMARQAGDGLGDQDHDTGGDDDDQEGEECALARLTAAATADGVLAPGLRGGLPLWVERVRQLAGVMVTSSAAAWTGAPVAPPVVETSAYCLALSASNVLRHGLDMGDAHPARPAEALVQAAALAFRASGEGVTAAAAANTAGGGGGGGGAGAGAGGGAAAAAAGLRLSVAALCLDTAREFLQRQARWGRVRAMTAAEVSGTGKAAASGDVERRTAALRQCLLLHGTGSLPSVGQVLAEELYARAADTSVSTSASVASVAPSGAGGGAGCDAATAISVCDAAAEAGARARIADLAERALAAWLEAIVAAGDGGGDKAAAGALPPIHSLPPPAWAVLALLTVTGRLAAAGLESFPSLSSSSSSSSSLSAPLTSAPVVGALRLFAALCRVFGSALLLCPPLPSSGGSAAAGASSAAAASAALAPQTASLPQLYAAALRLSGVHLKVAIDEAEEMLLAPTRTVRPFVPHDARRAEGRRSAHGEGGKDGAEATFAAAAAAISPGYSYGDTVRADVAREAKEDDLDGGSRGVRGEASTPAPSSSSSFSLHSGRRAASAFPPDPEALLSVRMPAVLSVLISSSDAFAAASDVLSAAAGLMVDDDEQGSSGSARNGAVGAGGGERAAFAPIPPAVLLSVRDSLLHGARASLSFLSDMWTSDLRPALDFESAAAGVAVPGGAVESAGAAAAAAAAAAATTRKAATATVAVSGGWPSLAAPWARRCAVPCLRAASAFLSEEGEALGAELVAAAGFAARLLPADDASLSAAAVSPAVAPAFEPLAAFLRAAAPRCTLDTGGSTGDRTGDRTGEGSGVPSSASIARVLIGAEVGVLPVLLRDWATRVCRCLSLAVMETDARGAALPPQSSGRAAGRRVLLPGAFGTRFLSDAVAGLHVAVACVLAGVSVPSSAAPGAGGRGAAAVFSPTQLRHQLHQRATQPAPMMSPTAAVALARTCVQTSKRIVSSRALRSALAASPDAAKVLVSYLSQQLLALAAACVSSAGGAAGSDAVEDIHRALSGHSASDSAPKSQAAADGAAADGAAAPLREVLREAAFDAFRGVLPSGGGGGEGGSAEDDTDDALEAVRRAGRALHWLDSGPLRLFDIVLDCVEEGESGGG